MFVSVFKLVTLSELPGVVFICFVTVAIYIGYILAQLRLKIIAFVVQESEDGVPRGEIEVELASRAVESISRTPALFEGPNANSLTQSSAISSRVESMFQESIELAHSNSVYVFMCYSTFLGTVRSNSQRAVSILKRMESNVRIVLPDERIQFYIRKQYWMDQLTESERQQLDES